MSRRLRAQYPHKLVNEIGTRFICLHFTHILSCFRSQIFDTTNSVLFVDILGATVTKNGHYSVLTEQKHCSRRDIITLLWSLCVLEFPLLSIQGLQIRHVRVTPLRNKFHYHSRSSVIIRSCNSPSHRLRWSNGNAFAIGLKIRGIKPGRGGKIKPSVLCRKICGTSKAQLV